jgi:hypothetical protein
MLKDFESGDRVSASIEEITNKDLIAAGHRKQAHESYNEQHS